MKNLILICILLLAGNKIKAQMITATLSVKGNCDMCKKRIENAADIKGVKNCNWDEKTKVASITYNSEKTSMVEIEQAIAKKGYDTEGVKADEEAYKKLPKCCHYRTAECTDKK